MKNNYLVAGDCLFASIKLRTSTFLKTSKSSIVWLLLLVLLCSSQISLSQVCTPIYTFGKTDGDLISNVVIAGTTLANNTGTEPVNPSYTFFGPPTYSDANYSGELQAGINHSINITVGTFGNQNISVWIDFNNNDVFETAEKVGYTTTAIAANSSATISISLPCAASLGSHTMRIRDVWNVTGNLIDPCIEYGYGETEDYLVTITAPPTCSAPSNGTAASVLSSSAMLSWVNGCGALSSDVHLTLAGGGAPSEAASHPSANSPLAVSGLTNGQAYEFWVRSSCVDNVTSSWSGPYTFSTLLFDPQLAPSWPLTISEGTYSSIASTGTLQSSVVADNGQINITGLSPAIVINNVSYTNARMSSNGWVVLYAGTAPTSTTEGAILSTAVANGGVTLAPFNVDLIQSNVATCAAYTQTIGDEHIFEWANYSRYNATVANRTDAFNFQIRLNTTTGTITYVYGPMTIGTVPAQLPRVGWKTNSATAANWATDINNLTLNITGSPATCNWSNAVTGNANTSDMYLNAANSSVSPTLGLTYSWTPQSTPEPVRTFGAVENITPTSAVLNWTATTGATQYNVRYRSLGSCTWTTWSGNPVIGTTATLTGLSTGTTYQIQVQASNGVNSSIWSHIPTQAGGLGTNGYLPVSTFSTLVTCFPPVGLTATTISYSEGSFSWTAPDVTPLNYEYVVSTTQGLPTGTGTETSDLSISLDGLTAETNYYIYVRSNCGDGDYSTWVTTSLFTGYCQVTSTNTTYGIGNFTTTGGFSNINNTSGPGTYTNYTTQSASSNPGGVINFVISSINTTATQGMGIWIDWNNDLDFSDTGEQVYASGAYVNVGSGSFTVPAEAVNGSYRMRVVTNWLSTTPTPCGALGNAAYGEAEDYTFIVSDPPSCPQPLTLTAVTDGTNVTLTWTELTTPVGGYEYVVSTTNEIPTGAGTSVSGLTVTVGDLIPGNTYYAFVRANCSDISTYSGWTTTSFYIGYCQVTSTSTAYGISNFTTTGGLTNLNNTTGPGSYNDYSATLSVSQYAGGNVNFTIASANGTAGMGLWIDWNNDLDFNDDGEHIYNSAAYVANGGGIITVPVDAPNGSYRMRVVANWLSQNPTPCGNLGNATYGEAEDYTFTVTDPPSCTPVLTLSAEPTGTSVILTWTELSSPLDGYEYVISSVNTLPTEDGTSVTGLTVTVDDLVPGTTYYAFVRGNCGEEDGYSNWVSTSFYIGYCQVTTTSTAYGISNFTTTNGLTNIMNPSGPGSYSDYTAQSVSMYESGSVNFSITSANGTSGMGIWVDWNNDLDFSDDGEHVYNSAAYMTTGTGTITVPIGTEVGSYRMRVVANWLSQNPTPCGNLGNAAYGEAEDYTFIVADLPACVPPSNFTAIVTSLTTATINWTVITPSSNGYDYVITPTPTEPTEGGTSTMETSANLDGLTFGTVYAYVRANCGEDGYSLWTGPIPITVFEGDEPCTAVELAVMGECVFQTFDNTGATTSSSPLIPAPGCANYLGTDMWFAVVVPANGQVIVDGIQGTLTDCGAAIYSSDSGCDSQLTLIACDDDTSDNGAMPYLNVTGQEPGSILYIRWWEYGGNALGTFGICVSTPCTAPGNPTLTVSANTATATWTSAGEGAIYNWEVRESGAPGSGATGLIQDGITDADVLSVLIENLGYASTYQFYVSTNCGEGVTSAWSTVVTFTTEVMQGCTNPEACNYNQDAMVDDGSCILETTTLYADADGDGFGNADESIDNCGATAEGYVANDSDCDDTNAEVWQLGDFYVDADGDGYDVGEEILCYGEETPEGYSTSTLGHDCDDEDPGSWEPSPIAVTLSLPIEVVCDNSAAFTLTGGSPAGGTWSGTGVTGSQFNPAGLEAPEFYEITYTVEGDGVCTTTASETDLLEVDDCISVDEVNEDAITLYPTFTNNYVTVVGVGLQDATIMDASGKRHATVSLFNTSIIDMHAYSAGIYFIQVSTQTNSHVLRVVKVN